MTKDILDKDGLKRTVDIEFHPALLDAIFSLAKTESLEWTLMAHMAHQADGSILIDDVIMPYQENSGSTTEIPNKATKTVDTEEVEFDPTYEWRTRDIPGIDENPMLMRAHEWNVCIHSHNTMKAFWSGTDTTELADTMAERNEPFVAIVVNSKREYECVVGVPSMNFYANGIIVTDEPSISDFVALSEAEQKRVIAQYSVYQELSEQLTKDIKTYTLVRPTYVPPPAYHGGSYWDKSKKKDKIPVDYNRTGNSSQMTMDGGLLNDIALTIHDKIVQKTWNSLDHEVEINGYYLCRNKSLIPYKRILDPMFHLNGVVKKKYVIAYCSSLYGPESIFWPESRGDKIPNHLHKYIYEQTITD